MPEFTSFQWKKASSSQTAVEGAGRGCSRTSDSGAPVGCVHDTMQKWTVFKANVLLCLLVCLLLLSFLFLTCLPNVGPRKARVFGVGMVMYACVRMLLLNPNSFSPICSRKVSKSGNNPQNLEPHISQPTRAEAKPKTIKHSEQVLKGHCPKYAIQFFSIPQALFATNSISTCTIFSPCGQKGVDTFCPKPPNIKISFSATQKQCKTHWDSLLLFSTSQICDILSQRKYFKLFWDFVRYLVIQEML